MLWWTADSREPWLEESCVREPEKGVLMGWGYGFEPMSVYYAPRAFEQLPGMEGAG